MKRPAAILYVLKMCCNLFATVALSLILKMNIMVKLDNQAQVSEEELVKRAQNSREAFGALYEIHYQRIFNYALKRTANVQLALDITSATFFKAMNQIGKYRWRDVPFAAWLYRIASNEISDHYRRASSKTVSLDTVSNLIDSADYADEVNQAEEELSKHEEFLMLHKKLAELPDMYQEVIVLKFFEKKKIKEMVKILGKKEGTIKSLLHRGIGKLREKMS
jgi:RNA polymerase sigma-70 factor, ECF subfamily